MDATDKKSEAYRLRIRDPKCACVTGLEWSGSPNPKHPDTEWVCDDCGRVIIAEAA